MNLRPWKTGFSKIPIGDAVERVPAGTGFPHGAAKAAQQGSTFVIVLWIAFGLVSLTLYFAHSMSFELKASDSRVCGLAAEQAIEGATRYLSYVLVNFQTNGVMPEPSTYLNEGVKVGEAHFWLIGRETNSNTGSVGLNQVSFGLIDEASKLNLNTATSNMLIYLPNMTEELAIAILDWRDTNGGSGTFETYYGMLHPPYQNKSAPFESADELRWVYGADMDLLVGNDLNRNGVLDPDEAGQGRATVVVPGLLEYVTVYSREPNTYSNGTARINIRNLTDTSALNSLLQSTLDAGRANTILSALQPAGGGGPGAGGNRGGPAGPNSPGGGGTQTFNSPLEFYQYLKTQSSMTVEEFGAIARALTTTNGAYIEGRVNVNTASAAVLACLPGIVDNPGLEQMLISYRELNPGKLTSVAWVVEALGANNTEALARLAAEDCITTESYQFTADIAALGPHGRGYRRVRFVFDTADGTPKIIYRQDLTHLGWALGKDVRQTWLLAKDTQ